MSEMWLVRCTCLTGSSSFTSVGLLTVMLLISPNEGACSRIRLHMPYLPLHTQLGWMLVPLTVQGGHWTGSLLPAGRDSPSHRPSTGDQDF